MYSSIVIEHFKSPRNVGELPDANGVGVAGIPGQGPFVAVWLKVARERVVACTFKTYGCAPAIAAGSMLTEWVRGKSVQECLALTDEDLTQMLGGLPEHKLHCPAMAIQALRKALLQTSPITSGEAAGVPS